MNKIQLIILWLIGLVISSIISLTGQQLLLHVSKYKETWETGYPLTLMAGTMWAYIVPIIIMGAILIFTASSQKAKKGKR